MKIYLKKITYLNNPMKGYIDYPNPLSTSSKFKAIAMMIQNKNIIHHIHHIRVIIVLIINNNNKKYKLILVV